MRFEWDDRKSRSNWSKHGISFEAATFVFDDPMHVTEQDRDVDGEERWQTIGIAEGMLLLLVAHTVEDEGEEVVRIISAREATTPERRRYEEGS
jgi:uncharacterized protein